MSTCTHCDDIGGEKTCANQVCMPLNGTVRSIDYCIHPLIAALNAAGLFTLASCCGHTKEPGRIDLMDGRVLAIFPDESSWCDRLGNTRSSR